MENPSNEQHQSDDFHDDDAINLFNEINNDSDDSDDDDVNELDHEFESDESDSDESEQEADPSSADDPWKNAPEALRNQYKELENKYQQLGNDHRANSGRVSALTKKLNEVQASLQKNEAKHGTSANTDQGLPSANDLKGKSFAEVEEEWPELAEYMRHEVQKALSTVDEKLRPVRELEQQREQQQEREFISSQFEQLERVHPDYREIATSPTLGKWLATQPASVQEMAKSTLAADNIALLTLFKSHHPTKSAANRRSKGDLSDYAEIPRKGAGKALSDSDDVDSIAYFNQINS